MINNNMNQNNQTTNDKSDRSDNSKPDESAGMYIRGHIKITDPNTGEVIVNKSNAIHYENISEAIAYSLANKSKSFIYEMHFGNGGTTVDPTGVVNYLPPNTKTQNSDLYNPSFYKNVDNTSIKNTDTSRNKIEIRHVPGTVYSDILVTCLLDYGEPNLASPGNLVGETQSPFDNSQNLNGSFIFDELGLKGYSESGDGKGKLLTHVIFHPVQKSNNRLIEIEYTIRIQTITNLANLG
jgi:hypothetical protein